MKNPSGLIGLWRFPIIGEETWAGVCVRNISSITSSIPKQILLEPSHVTSPQQFSR